MEALGALDVDVLATIGTRVDPAMLGVIPPNVHVERFVPQRFVFERASASMSHAGAGSLLGAAASGLPQVLFPSFADQWENADAASSAGVAITLEMDERSASDIGTAVSRVLTEESFRDAAHGVAAEISAMPSPDDHVATIEALDSRTISD
jgi:UDP:flavonoid glycosyltransferase YjiC (YdhE family)